MNLSLFEELKPTLRDKWLDYYKSNKLWLVDVLGLNFDPEKELEKRRKQNCKTQQSAIITTPQQE